MLSEAERHEVFLLLVQGMDGRLPAAQERRLRSLMVRVNPSAPRLSWDELMRAGRILVGTWVFFRVPGVEA